MDVIRDISVILLAAGAFLCTLVPLILSGALVYGVWWLRGHRNLPSWLSTIRGYVMLGLSYVEQAMRAVVKPVIAGHAAFATVKGWLSALRRSVSRRTELARQPARRIQK